MFPCTTSTLAKWKMRERLISHYSEPRNFINQLNFPIQLHQLQFVTEPGLGPWCLYGGTGAQFTAAHLALADEHSPEEMSLGWLLRVYP